MRQSQMAIGRSHPADLSTQRRSASSTKIKVVKKAKGSMKEVVFSATEWEDDHQSDASENTN